MIYRLVFILNTASFSYIIRSYISGADITFLVFINDDDDDSRAIVLRIEQEKYREDRYTYM